MFQVTWTFEKSRNWSKFSFSRAMTKNRSHLIHFLVLIHFDHKKDVNNDISATNWLLVIFIDPSIDIEITLKIWDAFLCEGNKVLIRWVLAIYMYHEKRLMNAKDQGQVMQILRYYKVEQKVNLLYFSSNNSTYCHFRSLMLFKTWLIIAWIHSHDDILMAYERACWKSMNTIHGRSSFDNNVTKTYCYWCFSFYPLYSELILLSFLSSKFLPHNKVIYSSYT